MRRFGDIPQVATTPAYADHRFHFWPLPLLVDGARAFHNLLSIGSQRSVTAMGPASRRNAAS